MDGGAQKAAVHGIATGWTQPSEFTFTFHFHALEKEMANHSSVFASRIPGTGEPGGLPSMGSPELDMTEATQQQQWIYKLSCNLNLVFSQVSESRLANLGFFLVLLVITLWSPFLLTQRLLISWLLHHTIHSQCMLVNVQWPMFQKNFYKSLINTFTDFWGMPIMVIFYLSMQCH